MTKHLCSLSVFTAIVLPVSSKPQTYQPTDTVINLLLEVPGSSDLRRLNKEFERMSPSLRPGIYFHRIHGTDSILVELHPYYFLSNPRPSGVIPVTLCCSMGINMLIFSILGTKEQLTIICLFSTESKGFLLYSRSIYFSCPIFSARKI